MKKQWELEDWKEAGAVIGENVTAYDSFIDIAFPWLVEIGDDTVLTGATILAHDASTHRETGYSKVGLVSIGKRCFLGHGSIVMPGVTIGDDCIVGAGTVVTKDLPNGTVFAGGKIICNTVDYIRKHKERISSGLYPVLDDNRWDESVREEIRKKGGYAK